MTKGMPLPDLTTVDYTVSLRAASGPVYIIVGSLLESIFVRDVSLVSSHKIRSPDFVTHSSFVQGRYLGEFASNRAILETSSAQTDSARSAPQRASERKRHASFIASRDYRRADEKFTDL